MTEQEYEKLVSESAETHSKNGLPPLVFDAAARFRDKTGDEQTLGVIRVIEVAAFKAGVKWARENPAPEVREMIQALIMVCHEWDAPEVYQSQVSEALTRFKERSKG